MSLLNKKVMCLSGLPEDFIRKAKAAAALRGMTLKAFVVTAILREIKNEFPAKKPFLNWVKLFDAIWKTKPEVKT